MYERAYGKEHLWEEAGEDLVEETYKEIVDAEDIDPIDRPQVQITQSEEGKPLVYAASVVIRPEVGSSMAAISRSSWPRAFSSGGGT